MKITISDIGGSIAKEDERYVVKDNTTLKNLVLSSTDLKPTKSTAPGSFRTAHGTDFKTGLESERL